MFFCTARPQIGIELRIHSHQNSKYSLFINLINPYKGSSISDSWDFLPPDRFMASKSHMNDPLS